MSKGIIKITPKPGVSGQVQVTVAETNPFNVAVGSILTIGEGGGGVRTNTIVDITITSATSCNVNMTATQA